jgi:hypothetical protein
VSSTDVLGWESHPLRRERPAKSILLVALIVASSAAAAFGFEHWFYGVFSLGALTVSLSRYFFLTRYVLDGEGISSEHLGLKQRRAWAEFRRADEHRDGIFLRPSARPGRLDSYRGVFLRCDQNREEVARFVRCHVPSQ